jgi:hypothetical protein
VGLRAHPMGGMPPLPDLRSPAPGLCADCRHARRVATPRSLFVRCARAAEDPAYPRYPRLPVRACPGYEPGGTESVPPDPMAAAD